MIRKPVRQGMALALLLCLPWLTACTSMSVSKSPVVDGAFGESVRQARARQLVNPDAGRNRDPVAGLDAEAGRSVMDAYYKSFKEPPRTFNVLGIGGSSIGAGP